MSTLKSDAPEKNQSQRHFRNESIIWGSLVLLVAVFYVVIFISLISNNALSKILQNLYPWIKITVCIVLEGFLVVCLACISRISQKWFAREISLDEFITNEWLFSFIRISCYISMTITIIAVMVFDHITYSKCFGLVAALNVFPLGFCIQHELFRKTFRDWPNFIIAVSGCLLYIATILIPYPSSHLLGFISEEEILAIASRLIMYLASGMIITAFVVVLQNVGKIAFTQMYYSETGAIPDKWQSFKRVRLRLLTHSNGQQNSAKGFMDRYIWAIPFVILGCIALFVPLMTTEENVSLPLSFHIGILGIGTFLLGVLAHFDASDESLLKSEYYYVYFKAKSLKKEDIELRSGKWKDYCQVVANVYCSGSGVMSEDEFLHQLWSPALEEMRNKQSVCVTQLIMDLVRAQSDVYSAYFSDDSNSTVAKNSRIAADTILNIVKKHPRRSVDSNDPYRFIDVLLSAMDCMFTKEQGRWERSFRINNLSTEEVISMLFADVCDVYGQKHSSLFAGCRAKQYCDQCECSINDTEAMDGTINRMVFLLSFPFIIQELAKARWEFDLFKIYNIAPKQYYMHLFQSEREHIQDDKMLRKVYDQWNSYAASKVTDFESFCVGVCGSITQLFSNEDTSDKAECHKKAIRDIKSFAIKEKDGWFIQKTPLTSNAMPNLIKSKLLVYLLFYKL